MIAAEAAPAPEAARAGGAPLRVLFLVRSLHRGGAERQLCQLARGLRREGHAVSVAVFYGGGAFERLLAEDGVPLHDLRKSGRWDTLPFLLRLARLVRRERPDVLHAYMGANFFASALKPLLGRTRVVWGIRSAKHDLGAYDWATRIGPLLHRALAPLADGAIANSAAARAEAARRGLDARRVDVVPNGIDCDGFRPDAAEGARQREAWGVPAGAPLVGVVARLDPVKDHAGFLRAARRVADARDDVRFVCVGGGSAARRRALERLAAELGLEGRVRWAGEQEVGRGVYSALDVAVLPSAEGESFPNALAEAMACGVPCVVTRTGDAAEIVGDGGVLVPPRSPEALAAALHETLGWTAGRRAELGRRARDRVVREYSVPRLVSRTTQVLARVRGA